MMQCYLCKDTEGAFEIEEYKKKCVLMCERCAKKVRKEREKNETTHIRNKRHVSRVPRTYSRSK